MFLRGVRTRIKFVSEVLCVCECVFIDVKKCAKRADFRRVSRDNFNVNVLFKIQLNEMIIEKTVE